MAYMPLETIVKIYRNAISASGVGNADYQSGCVRRLEQLLQNGGTGDIRFREGFYWIIDSASYTHPEGRLNSGRGKALLHLLAHIGEAVNSDELVRIAGWSSATESERSRLARQVNNKSQQFRMQYGKGISYMMLERVT